MSSKKEFVLELLLPYVMHKAIAPRIHERTLYHKKGKYCAVGQCMLPAFLESMENINFLLCEHGEKKVLRTWARGKLEPMEWLWVMYISDSICLNKSIYKPLRKLEAALKESLTELIL